MPQSDFYWLPCLCRVLFRSAYVCRERAGDAIMPVIYRIWLRGFWGQPPVGDNNALTPYGILPLATVLLMTTGQLPCWRPFS